MDSILPEFRKQTTILIKLGGSILENNELDIYEDIALLKKVGARVLIVHGGGKRISKSLAANGIDTEFIGGYRVTDEDGIKIVEEVLSGGVNKAIVGALKRHGIKPCGISGRDADLICAKRKRIIAGDIGYVGEIESVNPSILKLLMENDYTPVISPVSDGEEGEPLNINADDAAFAIAEALKVDTLVFLTDVDGILLDVDNDKTVINVLEKEKATALLENGFIGGGMIPKLKNCINSIDNGVNEVAIINGGVKYNLVSYFITRNKIGTTIRKEKNE